ncbi:MAG: hypothetical protein ACRC2T_05820, partial [Thermoguttaceae bacterium]
SRASIAQIESGGKFTAYHTANQEGVPTGTVTVHVIWGGRYGTEPPEEYTPLMKDYGFTSAGLPVEISKKNKNLKIDFPEKRPETDEKK